MKILIGCEFSGIVRSAFAAMGHNAWSCDLLPTEVPGNHIIGNVLDVLDQGWDMAIFHPPCTYLSVSGMHWTTRGLRDPKLTEEALRFVQQLMDAPIPRIAIENPVSVISTRIRKPDQVIQPWMFGHDASKKTCFWLKGLPKLRPSQDDILPPSGWYLVHDGHTPVRMKKIDGFVFGSDSDCPNPAVWGNQTKSGQNKLPPSKDRWKERSKTYQGIANAMALQWGIYHD